jgi:hypothetical protein
MKYLPSNGQRQNNDRILERLWEMTIVDCFKVSSAHKISSLDISEIM